MRNDYRIINNLIKKNSKVLEIGCAEGQLLSFLKEQKNVISQGVDIDQEKVIKCLENGLDVIQGDINNIIDHFPENQFDVCILTHTLQTVINPKKLLIKLQKVAKRVFVSFDNAGYYKNYLKSFFNSSMNGFMQKDLNWYDTYFIRPCTIKDFQDLSVNTGFKIISVYDVNSMKKYDYPKMPSSLKSKEVLFTLES